MNAQGSVIYSGLLLKRFSFQKHPWLCGWPGVFCCAHFGTLRLLMTESIDITYTARVVEEHKSSYILRPIRSTGAHTRETKDNANSASAPLLELTATLRGNLLKSGDFPKVGDIVEYSIVETLSGDKTQAVIESIHPRRTEIVRDIADRSRRRQVERPQIIVANVDVMFIVMGLDGDFNPLRLDRYVTLAVQNKVQPVIILNKADIIENKSDYEAQVATIAPAVPIHFVSARTGEGMQALLGYLVPDKTGVLLGSSGAGKSTITNWLLESDIQVVGGVRLDDSRGRHTTTSRALFDLPNGGHLIDTPGMRGLGLMSSAESAEAQDPTMPGGATGAESIFADIEALQLECQYPDCDHEKSTGCAIQAAIENGTIPAKHFNSYLKLKREQAYTAAKAEGIAGQTRKDKSKRIHKEYNKIKRHRYKDHGAH